ncbi:hypothetical protein G7046_g7839 [Stylonectria norvegica]|nr:hypothetical protein G7046_g7839 [Stylonectria norvegica]
MSMLAMATMSAHPTFGGQHNAWLPDYSLRPRVENDRVELPSIRQAFPELTETVQAQNQTSRPASTRGSISVSVMSAASPEYIHSPNPDKRRRFSDDDDQQERARQVPRHYYSQESSSSRQLSPSISSRAATLDSWPASARTSPYLPQGLPPTPASLEKKERVDPRASFSTLPPPRALEMDPAPSHLLPAPADNYQASRAPMPQSGGAPAHDASPSSAYRDSNYGYSFHHPSRYQSLSASSVHPFDRTPFTGGGYGAPYQQDFVRYGGDLGPQSLGGDNKQRKRRGNLPKETTDKLRSWFMLHLQHPYPTEDEKQDLMRQTGLQMNQISNWFINARRRQLPTMMNNARVESDAMAGTRSGGDLKVLATTERGEFGRGHGRKRSPAGGPLSESDGDGAAYDEELDGLKQHRAARGSV